MLRKRSPSYLKIKFKTALFQLECFYTPFNDLLNCSAMNHEKSCANSQKYDLGVPPDCLRFKAFDKDVCFISREDNPTINQYKTISDGIITTHSYIFFISTCRYTCSVSFI